MARTKTNEIEANRKAMVGDNAVMITNESGSLTGFMWSNTKLFFLRVFRNGSVKSFAFHNFLTEKSLLLWFSGLAEAQVSNDKYREERKASHNCKVGDVFHASWGYDQTNNNFYEIVELVGKKSAKFREIAQTYEENGWCTGRSTPLPGQYVRGAAVTKRISGHNSVRFDESRYASKITPDESGNYKSYYYSNDR